MNIGKTLFGYHDWPIKRKLSGIVILISGLLIGCMAIAVTVEKYYSYRTKLVKNSTVLAEIVGANSNAALIFGDIETASEILAALRAEKDIIAACLHDSKGRVFSLYFNKEFYKHNSTRTPPLDSDLDLDATDFSPQFSGRYFDITRPIFLDEKTIGYIVLRTDLTGLKVNIQLFVAIISCFSLILFALGILICSRLNQTIIGPVTRLADTMQEVQHTQNFDVRMVKPRNDEIGVLIDGFNSMLAQIGKRDAELARQQNHLEELVDTRTGELKTANELLLKEIEERREAQARLVHAQKMEAIGTLAGGVAHDLNNILSGVVSYPDLLLLDLPEDSKLRQPIKIIRSSGKKAAAIVQDLLTLARRGVKVSEQVDLRQLIGDYLISPEHRELERNHPGVQIFFERDGRSCLMNGSPVHLSKTVMNLVSNAAEAISDDGTVGIHLDEVYLESQPLDFTQWRKGYYIRLTVADTGSGIPEQYLGRIFEPFYTRKVMGRSGTGLGMAVVWGTVEDHNGNITVASKEGRGTTFKLLFPACDQPKLQPILTSLTEEQFHGQGQTVLVVDDSEDQRQIASDILNRLGYMATTVADGEEAVEYLRHTMVDLVLLDMLMAPGIDGLETFRRIREFRPDQKAIIASGYSHSARIEKAMSFGISEYVVKPYTVKCIGQAVHSTLMAS